MNECGSKTMILLVKILSLVWWLSLFYGDVNITFYNNTNNLVSRKGYLRCSRKKSGWLTRCWAEPRSGAPTSSPWMSSSSCLASDSWALYFFCGCGNTFRPPRSCVQKENLTRFLYVHCNFLWIVQIIVREVIFSCRKDFPHFTIEQVPNNYVCEGGIQKYSRVWS